MTKIYLSTLLATALLAFGGGDALAQTNVTSTYLDNADFSLSTAVTLNVCGYQKDISNSNNQINGTDALYWAQDVDKWTVATEKADASAGAVFAYGSEPKLAGNNKSAPSTNPSGGASGNALGIFAIWKSTIQYTQAAKTALLAGHYDLTYTYYNQSGKTAVAKNLIGFAEESGTTHYGTTTSFTEGSWKTETISFDITSATKGTFSIGYQSNQKDNGVGSGSTPMLFIDNITLFYGANKTELQTAIANATTANGTLSNSTLTSAITTAQGVCDAPDATQAAVDKAVTELNAAIETAKKDAANNHFADGADVTLLITNNSFENGETGWEYYKASDTGVKDKSSSTYATSDVDGTHLFNTWDTGTTDKYVRQTLTNLPEGFYSVSALVASDAGLSVDIVAGDTKTNISADATNGKSTFVSGTTEKVYVPANGSLVIGATSTNWYKVDKFQLTYYTIANNEASDEEISDLNTAISTHKIGFGAGEYAPYNNVAAMKAHVRSNAIAINNATKKAKTAVNAATTALKSDSWKENSEEVNAIYDGSFNLTTDLTYTYSNVKYPLPTGWTNTGFNTRIFNSNHQSSNAGIVAASQGCVMMAKFETSYGTETGYTMPLKAGVYKLSFVYGGFADYGARTITLTSGSGDDAITLTPTVEKVTSQYNDAQKDKDHWQNYEGYFIIETAGDYVLNFNKTTNKQNQVGISDIVLKTAYAVVLDETAGVSTNFKGKADVNLNRTFAAGWNSVVLPFATTAEALGADEAAEYKGTENDKLVFSTVTDLAANTPYLVHFSTAQTEAKTFKGVTINPATELKAPDANKQYDFVGTYTALEKGNTTIVKGDYITVKTGIQKAAGSNALKAFRAYFKANSTEAASEAKNMVLVIDDNTISTGINAVNAESVSDGNVYNVAGQKVSGSYKGLVIKNGKKYLRK